MKQKRIFIPTKDAESWKALLADPNKHWKPGYSAKLAAESWELFDDVPIEIRKALNGNEHFNETELILAIPEFKVALPGGNRPSQNDLLVLVSNSNGLSVITVEAKAKEDFDNKIVEWKKEESEGKKERLKFLIETINYPNINIDNLKYQLFHRLASAIIMAKKFHAKNAMMIIQSFIENDKENHFFDYCDFIIGYGIKVKKNVIQKITVSKDIDVFTIWVQSKMQ